MHLALVALVALAACAGDDGGASAGDTSDTGDTGGLIAEFEAECAGLLSCGCDVGFADAAICAVTFADQWESLAESAAMAGLEADFACYKATRPYTTFGCQTEGEYDEGLDPAACSYCQFGYGTRALGEPCTPQVEGVSDCAQGLRCAGEPSPTCVDPCDPAAAGQSCEFARCADGLFCDFAFDVVCVAPGKAGEPCAGGNNVCEEGLFCIVEEGRLCRPPSALGESCEFIPCQGGLACDLNTRLCAEPAGAGEGCALLDCAVGLYCDLDELCKPPGGDGEPCIQHHCVDGLVCDEVELCGPPPGLGEPCSSGCAGDLWCNFETLKCVELPGDGEPCLFQMCAADLLCYGEPGDDPGICAPELAEVCVAP